MNAITFAKVKYYTVLEHLVVANTRSFWHRLSWHHWVPNEILRIYDPEPNPPLANLQNNCNCSVGKTHTDTPAEKASAKGGAGLTLTSECTIIGIHWIIALWAKSFSNLFKSYPSRSLKQKVPSQYDFRRCSLKSADDLVPKWEVAYVRGKAPFLRIGGNLCRRRSSRYEIIHFTKKGLTPQKKRHPGGSPHQPLTAYQSGKNNPRTTKISYKRPRGFLLRCVASLAKTRLF